LLVGMTSKPQLVLSLSFHSFNKDRSLCCLAQNDEYCYIYKTNGTDDTTKWELDCELQEEQKGQAKKKKNPPLHAGYVSGIDWHPETNQIVTCGHDRNAYVWKLNDEGVWIPLLVILRINRAATGVKWSPDGQKFAVSSGAKCVPVCHFETSQNWWISKMIKKPHRSTVLTLDWSPNGKFIVTGGCDFKARIFSAFIEDIDDPATAPYDDWGKQNNFGECLAEFDQAKAWVQGVSWSPSGNFISWVGHGSTFHVADVRSKDTTTVFSPDLPFLDCQMVDDNKVIATGFSSNPHVWEKKGDTWEVTSKMDPETAGAKKKAGGAMAKFMAADKKGQEKDESAPITTFHKNVIRDVTAIKDGDKVLGITTSGLDGRIIDWRL